MFASAFILVFSLVLFVYWFRYSCILLLKNKPDVSVPASLPVGGYQAVQQGLRTDSNLAELHTALRRDFEVLTYLVEHASGLGWDSLEDRLLVIDYKLMHLWYRLTKSIFPTQARRALAEMASVMDMLVRRVADQSRANAQA